MFDLSKLGDMTKVAKQAQSMQAAQERAQQEQLTLLKEISVKLETVITLLQKER